MLNHCLEWDKRTYALQTVVSNFKDTYFTVVNGRSCSLHGRSFAHAWVHPCSYKPVIPLHT